MASTMPRPAPPGYPYALSICARDEADACKSGSSYKAGDGSTVCLVREWLAAGPWRWLTGELPHGTSGLEYPRSNRELAESYQRSFQIRSHRRRSVRFSESFQRGKADWSVWTHLINTKVVRQPKTLQSFRGIKASSAAKALQPGGASIGASSLDFSQRLFQTFTRVRGQIFAATLASLLGKS